MWYMIVLIALSWSSMTNPVKKHVWTDRVLIVTASSPGNIGYKRQSQLLEKGKKGMKERDLVIYRLYSDHWVGPSNQPLSQEQADAIYEAYDIAKDTFSVTLIGKDGGVKLRKVDLVSTREIFELIDGMPMRMRE